MADQYRRALLAFPDEDVLLGTRLLGPEGFRAFYGLQDVVPFPEHKSSGEERAWARRLSKRFGCESKLDDRTFVLKGDGSVAGGLDFFAQKVKIPEGVDAHFNLASTPTGVTAWSPSAGPWPRTWRRASSGAEPCGPGSAADHPRGSTAAQTL